jgi:hypothetical protein
MKSFWYSFKGCIVYNLLTLKLNVMKRVIFVIGATLLTGSLIAGANGVVNKAGSKTVLVQDDPKKEKVDVDQLPQAIKNTLAGDDYKGWTIESAYLVKGEKEYYQITLKQDHNSKTVNLDKDGNTMM